MSTQSETAIRPYKDSDSDALLSLIRELQAYEHALFDRMKNPADIGDWYIENIKQQIDRQGGEILIAENDGQIIGYATVLTAIKQDAPDEIVYSYALVADIAVAKEHRSTGIGKRLLTECEKLALNAGAKWLRIMALADNERALAVYRRAGFADLFVELEKPLG